MQSNPSFPQGLPMEQMLKFAATPQGQAIITQLQSSHPKELDAAISQAQAGNYQQLQQTLSSFLNSPAGKELMKQLRG